MDLTQCLSAASHRTLIAIARCQGFRAHKGIPKDSLVRQLADHLGDAARLHALLDDCRPDERRALHRLAASDGRMPAHDFTRQFGPIRPYRPWRTDSVRHPWRNPISISERLLYLGLIYLTRGNRERGEPAQVVLPAEFLSRIAPPAPTVALGLPATEPGEPVDPCLDMAIWLAYLQQMDVRPLHGRWLSPVHIRRVAARLRPPEPVQGARSELQTDRLRFIHYLGESLGLIAVTGGRLKPAPRALAWLEKPTPSQWRDLWDAWLDTTGENRERWTRYRLPGSRLRDPFRFVRNLLPVVATCPADHWLSVGNLVENPRLGGDDLIPWWEREERDAAAILVGEVLRGPLTALGVVRVQSTPAGLLWRLTPQGAWLLDRGGELPAEATALLQMSEDLTLTLPPDGCPAGLLALAGWTEWGSEEPALRLTPDSVAQALASRSPHAPLTSVDGSAVGSHLGGNAALQDLCAALSRYAEPVLGDNQRATLERWAREAQIVTLRRRLILELPDGMTMDRLPSDPLFRSCVQRMITPDSAILQGQDQEQVIQWLRQQGFHVRSVEPDQRTAELDSGGAFWLATATLVLDHLARRLAVTPIPPSAVLDWLAAHLDPATLASAERGAAHAIARLNEALDGPAPALQGMALDDALRVIQDAIAGGECLQLRYWSAWRGEVTERIVEPARVEWRGDAAYLIGYCRLRRAERTFRLDRVLDVRRCERAPTG
jgi:hypothetical protein